MKKFLTTALAIAALASSGAALAGGTFTASTLLSDRSYVREDARLNTNYTLPGFTMTYNSTLFRSYTDNFLMSYTLNNGAVWSSGLTSAMFTATATGGCTYTATLQPGWALSPTANVLFSVVPVNCLATSPVVVVFDTQNAAVVRDVTGLLMTGGVIGLQASMIDSATGIPIDQPPSNLDLITSGWSVVFKSVTTTTGIIDLNTPSFRMNFYIPNGVDTTLIDKGAIVTTVFSSELLPSTGLNGNYIPVSTDCVQVTFTGPMGGVQSISYGHVGTYTMYTLTAADRLSSSVTFTVPADTAGLGENARIRIAVTGTNELTPRTFSIIAELRVESCATPVLINPFLASPTLFTTWDYNGTMLVASWMNGNSNSFHSRVYLTTIGCSTCDPLLGASVVFRITDSRIHGGASGTGTYIPLPDNIFDNTSRIVKIEGPDGLLQLYGWNDPFFGPEGSGNIMVEFLVGADKAQGRASIINITIPGGPVTVGSYSMISSNQPNQAN